MRAVIYARYPSDKQSDRSIEDQARLYRERIAADGHTVTEVYSDHAISGATLLRPGIQAVMAGRGEARAAGSTDPTLGPAPPPLLALGPRQVRGLRRRLCSDQQEPPRLCRGAQQGECSNRLAIGRASLENTILNGLKRHLMAPDLFKEFCDEFVREVNRLRQEETGRRAAYEGGLTRVRRRISRIVEAIADGAPARSLKDELLALERREDELRAKLAAAPEPKVYLSPNMVEIYRQRVAALHDALGSRTGNVEEVEAIRALIEKIVLTPRDGRLVVDLHGEAAAILKLSSRSQNRAKKLDDVAEQLVVAAGACNHLDLQLEGLLAALCGPIQANSSAAMADSCDRGALAK